MLFYYLLNPTKISLIKSTTNIKAPGINTAYKPYTQKLVVEIIDFAASSPSLLTKFSNPAVSDPELINAHIKASPAIPTKNKEGIAFLHELVNYMLDRKS